MSYDLKRSHFSIVLEKPVLAGAVITEEGVLLQATTDAATGTEVVSMATNDASLLIAGFAIRDNADNATTSEVEDLGAVPAGLLMQLANNNIVSTADTGLTTNIQVTSSEAGILTLANTGNAASGVVGVNPTTGGLDFHADELGDLITVQYTYNLTVAEARLKFFQRNINNEASTLFGSVGVGHGHGEVFTDQFDATVDWSVAAQAVHSGDGGQITETGGTALDARVISVPNVNNPLLGLAFNIGGN